jgi:hypothetical protein
MPTVQYFTRRSHSQYQGWSTDLQASLLLFIIRVIRNVWDEFPELSALRPALSYNQNTAVRQFTAQTRNWIFQKLTVPQPIKQSTARHATPQFITVFTTARHLSIPSVRLTQHASFTFLRTLLQYYPPAAVLPACCSIIHLLRYYPPAAILSTCCGIIHLLLYYPPAAVLSTSCSIIHLLQYYSPPAVLSTSCSIIHLLQYYPPIYAHVFQVVLFSKVSPPKLCTHLPPTDIRQHKSNHKEWKNSG